MLKRIATISMLISTVSACGGGGGGSASGAGQIDYDSPTVVEDLQSSLNLVDSSIVVVAPGDGTLVLANGTDRLVITPGDTTATTIEISGTLYSVTVDPSGKYTYSPVTGYESATAFVSKSKLMMQDISVVADKIGLDPETSLVDLTMGSRNANAKAAPELITFTGTGEAVVGGQVDGWIASGNIDVEQTLTISHNFTDASVINAHADGWDGSGVNLTTLDNSEALVQDYAINQTIDATVTLTDGASTETSSIVDTGTSYVSIGHGTLVAGLATGLDWKEAIEGYYGVSLDDSCSAMSSTETSDELTIVTNSTVNSNFCGKIGIATGANSTFIDEADSNVMWDDLVKTKNQSDSIEILNFSFGDPNTVSELNVVDNHNVVIVNSAGNGSEPNNGFDVYGDGRDNAGSSDIYENMSISITESDFADNLVAVGALGSDGTIANYSTIAGSAYDGSSYAFLVEDGTVSIDFNSKSTLSGDLSLVKDGRTLSGNYEARLTEELSISTHGTSFAAPRVAGKIAIASQKFPNLNAEQLVNLAKYTAIDLGQAGIDEIYGHGKINLTGMLSPIGRLQ